MMSTCHFPATRDKHLRTVVLSPEGRVLHLAMFLTKRGKKKENNAYVTMLMSDAFCGQSWLREVNVKGFLSKIELEDMKWVISHIYPQEYETEELRDWFPVNSWLTEDQDLSPDQRTPTKTLSPSSSQWTYCLDSGWTSSSLYFLPLNRACPKPSVVSPAACCSMHF